MLQLLSLTNDNFYLPKIKQSHLVSTLCFHYVASELKLPGSLQVHTEVIVAPPPTGIAPLVTVSNGKHPY